MSSNNVDDIHAHNMLRTGNGRQGLQTTREESRQIAQHDAISNWNSESWWWMESPKFEKRYLIALRENVALIMTPTHAGSIRSTMIYWASTTDCTFSEVTFNMQSYVLI